MNDRPVPILRADYLLRRVEVPAANSTVVFRYEPDSFSTGVRLLVAALLALLPWTWWSLTSRHP